MNGKPSRRSRGTITIEDVARAAGVSAMTVSRVINQGKNVRDNRPAPRVLEGDRANSIIRRTPRRAASPLARRLHIGLLYANPSAAYLSQFLIGALACGPQAPASTWSSRPARSEDADEQARGHPPLRDQRRRRRDPAAAAVRIAADHGRAGRDRTSPVVTVAMGAPREDSLNVRIDDSRRRL